jgi:glycosyltransferase involved in cell wall biosynthesis
MKRRVALVATTTAEAGPAALALTLRFLVEAGWDARLLCTGERWREHPALRDPALSGRVDHVRRLRRGSCPFTARLRRLEPDVIHFESVPAAAGALARGRLGNARILVSPRGDGGDLARADVSLLSRQADLLVCGHRAGVERAVAHGWPRDRVAVVHGPVLDAGPATPPAPGTNGSLRVLSVGPVIWEHGLEHSVHAIALARRAGVRCRYAIVGDGDHMQAVAFARHQLGISDHVDLLGPDGGERFAAELRNAEVFLDPAVTDTTSPAPLMAARRHGVPFVATRRPGLAEQGGIAVPRRDPTAIADALRRLAAEPALRAQLAEQSRSAARPDDHLGELERLYHQAVDR